MPIKQFTNLDYDLYALYVTITILMETRTSSSDPATFKQTIIEALASGAIGYLSSSFKTY